MKLTVKKLKKLFSENDKQLLFETVKNKSSLIEKENMDYQNKIYLLKQEVNKKYMELRLYFQNELKKINVEYQQKLKDIDLQ
jgi:hypothetical protein